MYKTLQTLSPYFYSLREVNGNVGLDIKIPLYWNPNVVNDKYPLVTVHVTDKDNDNQLLVLVTVVSEDGYSELIKAAQDLIRLNKEEEQKQELFKKMVSDLEKMFKSESLDNIKGKNLFEKHESDTTGTGAIGQGDEKGSEGDSTL